MTTTKLFLGIIGIVFLVIAGCVAPPAQPPGNNPPATPPSSAPTWMYYAPVQAQTNPWQVTDIAFVNTPTELQQVQAWLSSINVNFSEAVFVPHDEIVCEALNCPRGDYLLVNPSDSASRDVLSNIGFLKMNQPFVYVSNVSELGTFEINLVNTSNETIYYGGCNDYTVNKITNSGNVPLPGKTCVWEGIPRALTAGKTVPFSEQTNGNGTFNVSVGFSVGCAADKPLSQASCVSEKTITSNAFSVSSTINAQTISAVYDLKQCYSNPWQDDINGFNRAKDEADFTSWLNENGITPLHVGYSPAPEKVIVCGACACSSGEKYRIIISSSEQLLAESLGFTIEGAYIWPSSLPSFSEATWRVYTPYQCFANKWNVEKEAVRNIEKDFSLMKTWLEEQGVNVTYLGFIRGISLSQQCTKVSTDKYGVGTLDEASSDILSTLGFVVAGPQQTKLFTDMEDLEANQYLFKTKFCEAQPWGVDLTNGNEATVVERVMQWLADAGIPSYGKPTIHQINPSATGSCGTDSGLAVLVTVPAWAETHITPYGFGKITEVFDAEKSQVYPVVGISIKPYTTLSEYYAQIDYSCTQDSDCLIKDLWSCAGEYLRCVNGNVSPDSSFVQSMCYNGGGGPGGASVPVDQCVCIQNLCKSYYNSNPV